VLDAGAGFVFRWTGTIMVGVSVAGTAETATRLHPPPQQIKREAVQKDKKRMDPVSAGDAVTLIRRGVVLRQVDGAHAGSHVADRNRACLMRVTSSEVVAANGFTQSGRPTGV